MAEHAAVTLTANGRQHLYTVCNPCVQHKQQTHEGDDIMPLKYTAIQNSFMQINKNTKYLKEHLSHSVSNNGTL